VVSTVVFAFWFAPAPCGRSADLPAAGASSAAQGHGFRRWAILGSPTAVAKGLPDLLLTSLGEAPGIEWVERSDAATVDRTLTREAAYVNGAASRVMLGKTLGAQALVLLSLDAGGQFLECTVAESVYGSRLSCQLLDAKTTPLEELVRRCAAQVAAARQKLAAGIRVAVVILPFRGELPSEPGAVRAEPGAILEAALVALPHIAVIETRAAPELRHERTLSLPDDVPQPSWLFVEGTLGTNVAAPARLDMRLTLSDRRGYTNHIERLSVTAQEVEACLSLDLPGEVLRYVAERARKGTTLTPQARFAALVAAADGTLDADHASGLREAALLIDPSSAEQRKKLVEAYGRQVHASLSMGYEMYQRLAREQALQDSYWHGITRWYRGLDHMEYLIRNRGADADFAVRRTYLLKAGFQFSRVPASDGVPHPRTAIEARKKDYLLNVAPRVLRLDDARNHYFGWHMTLFRNALMRYDWQDLRKEDYRFLLDLLEAVASGTHQHVRAYRHVEGREACSVMVRFLARPHRAFSGTTNGGEKSPASESDFIHFLKRLRASRHPVNRAYGVFGLLAHRARTGKLTTHDLQEYALWTAHCGKFAIGGFGESTRELKRALAELTEAPDAAGMPPSGYMAAQKAAYLAQFERYWQLFTQKHYEHVVDCLERLAFDDVWTRIAPRSENDRVHYLLYEVFHAMDTGIIFRGSGDGPAIRELKNCSPEVVLQVARETFWPYELRAPAYDGAYQWAVLADKPRGEHPESILNIGIDQRRRSPGAAARIRFVYAYEGGRMDDRLRRQMRR